MDISALNHLPLQFVLLLLLLLNNYETVAYHDDTHNVAKRLDVDVCAERFDIHSSTIIRTEESKAMGAKFLNDDDVASADACLKLCCETSECDVFIFEEKSAGTCFLFHCGLPDDFRCKFTSHSNYTSGVLTVPRRDLESPTIPPAAKPKLSQNELELVNLKRPSNAYHLSPEVIPSTTSTIPPLGIRLADVTSVSSVTTVKSSCGRFQFQCQTSKECIAIYNVCDQIAQCDDGSDEGPECPASNSVPSKAVLTGVENQPKLDGQLNRNRGVMPVNMNDNFNQMPRPMLHNREDPMSAPKYPQSHVTQYTDTDTDSRIFSHKNGLLGNGFPAQYPSKFQRDPYMMPQPGQQIMEEPMYREQPQMTRNDWPPQMIQQPQPLVPQVKPQSNSVWPEKLAKETPVDDKATRKKGQSRDSEYSEEYSEGDESQADGDDVTTTEAPKKKLRKHKKVKVQKDKQQKVHEKSLHEQLKQLKTSPDVEAQFISEHSGHVEKPTGAVLSLTLGCLVLAALSVLIGCRLRRVNVRRRRGKSVEADYLVNGLYL